MSWKDTIKDEPKKSWRDTIQDEESGGITARGLAKGFTEALPVAGGLAGGVIGTALGPLGTAGGAGLGAALGKSAENIIESTFFDEDKTRPEIYAEPVVEGVSAAAGEVLAPAAMKVVGKGVQAVGKGAKKVASSLSSVPEKAIETYAKRAPEVDKIASYDGGIFDEANRIREEAQQAIKSFEDLQNAKISRSVELTKDLPTDISGVRKTLEENIAKLDPVIDEDAVMQLQKEIDVLDAVAKDGKVSAAQALSIKNRLQGLSDYVEPGKKRGLVNATFQRAASRANAALSAVAPEIREANRELAKLRRMNKVMNKNIIKPDAPEAALVAAGTGTNERAASHLQRLGEIVDFPMLQRAEDLAAAKYLGDASFLPSVATGAKAVPLAAGGTYALGQLYQGDLQGALPGLGVAAMGSPLGIKYGIKAGLLGARVAPEGMSQAIETMMRMAIQNGATPFDVQEFVRKDESLSPTEKGKALDKLYRQAK